MKRITSVVVLVVGLAGCISPTTPTGQGDKKNAPRPTAPGLPAGVTALPPTATAPWAAVPSNPQWSAHPAYLANRPPVSRPLQPQSASVPAPGAALPLAAQPTAPRALTQAVQSTARPVTAAQQVSTAKAAAPPQAKGPPPLPPGMPMAVTPRPEVKAPAIIQPVSHDAPASQADVAPPPIITAPAAKEKPADPAAEKPSPAPAKDAPAKEKPAGPQPEKAKPARATGPLVRLVNTRRITMNFQVQNSDPSGLSTVELWWTQDGKEWKKYDASPKAQACTVEVDDEGLYGFTLLARGANGLGKEPPKSGDQPQVWVIVDLSAPEVEVLGVTAAASAKARSLEVRWKAADMNLARQPVTLSYAEKEDGPWKVIATQLENTGKYYWQVPADAPAVFLVRVEASDLAGNVGRAQAPRPVTLNVMKPEVTITNVEAHPGQ